MAHPRTRPAVWSLATALVLSVCTSASSRAQEHDEAADTLAALVARLGGDDLAIDGELRISPELPRLVGNELPAGPAAARARLEQAISARSADALHTLARDLARIPGARALSTRAFYEEARLRTPRSPQWTAAMRRAARRRGQVEQEERSVVAAARLALLDVDVSTTWPRDGVIQAPPDLSSLVQAVTRDIQRRSAATTEAVDAYGSIAELRVPGAWLVVVARQAELYRALVLSMVRMVLVGAGVDPVRSAVGARIAATLTERARPVECYVLLRYWEVLRHASRSPGVAEFSDRATSMLRSAGRERLLECARDDSREDDILRDTATLTQLFPAQRTPPADGSADARRR